MNEPPPNPHDVWLSLRPAAAFLGVGPRRLNALRKSGAIPARKRGLFGWEFRETDLMEYVERAAGVPSPPPAPDATPPQSTSLADIQNAFAQIAAQRTSADEPPTDEGVNQSPLVRIVNAIIVSAVEGRASDIHVEPNGRNLRIRVRVDGTMREVMAIPLYIGGPVTKRFHIMADLDPFGKGLQMGRLPIKHSNQLFNLRVLSTPTLFGPSLIIRIIDQKTAVAGRPALGINPETCAVLDDASYPYPGIGGLLLFCGPAGSGLTTTAYAQLNRLNSVECKTLAIVPVAEYELGGIDTLLVQNENGVGDVTHRRRPTLSAALSAVLRGGDADVLFLGDLTGPETARAALEAAQAGVLTLATVNAPGAFLALHRLSEWANVPKERIAPLCRGVLVQRLVRRLNPETKESYEAVAYLLSRYGLPIENAQLTAQMPVTLYRPAADTPPYDLWQGRVGAFAFTSGDTLQTPREGLFVTQQNALAGDLLQKVLAGVTTVEEAYRASR